MLKGAGMLPLESSYNSPSGRQVRPEGLRRNAGDELELVKRAQQNDGFASSELYERYFDMIYRYVTLRTGDTRAAGDITQQVFLKAQQTIKGFRLAEAPFSLWLYRIARFQITRHRSTLAGGFHSRHKLPAMGEDCHDIESLISALSTLTPVQRELIALRFTSDLPLAEIAQHMGKSEEAIKSLQYGAMKALSRRMHTTKHE